MKIAKTEADSLVLLEAESFDELGGWEVDQQFMDQMGSPYLLAHGLGVPVPDARTTVTLPAAGRYRVWVRTYDWVAPWDAPGMPGRFELVINGETLATTFGTQSATWHWQDGGLVELGTSAEIALHDLTGFEGRCDAILFSADPDFVPPDSGEALAALRGALLGWDHEPEAGGAFDLVVIGGGIAGTSAAIAAARLGLTVALVQDRPVLGGNGSSEVRVWPEGLTRYEPYPRVGGVVDEVVPFRELKQAVDAKGSQHFDDRHKAALVQSEPNATLMLDHRLQASTTKAGAIRSVVVQHIRSGRRTRLEGRWFLDSTGDGILGAMAGADHEASAKGHMGTTNLWDVGETQENEPQIKCLCQDEDEFIALSFTPSEEEQPFPRCPWAVDLKDVQFPGRRGTETFGAKELKQLGNWFWESGFNKDIIEDGEYIRDLNLRAMYGAWDVLKNVDGMHANHRLKWAAFIAGKRESRRLMGDVILTADDIRDGKTFEDAAVPCTWHIDIHSPHPDYFEADDPDAFFSTFTRGEGYRYEGPYWMPYRCLYSRNISNLFMAGRDVSVSQTGLGAVRVMRTCGIMGEIVAMAASVCQANDCTPRDVYTDHLEALKALMKKGIGKAD